MNDKIIAELRAWRASPAYDMSRERAILTGEELDALLEAAAERDALKKALVDTDEVACFSCYGPRPAAVTALLNAPEEPREISVQATRIGAEPWPFVEPGRCGYTDRFGRCARPVLIGHGTLCAEHA